uniref:DUF6824 domain-containing protein n=1 Tax=Pseudictyota dubia TaxID=2749911 RepID=A0A7R9ZGE1_9STRA|mmetsp:Transcript_48437/g.89858  ORF Transcript_48437/g.89858 Transcript_48437/m.89858 type:complete len:494 (+) Transcript_48437:248-1729(+)|eukprot:CAMPEP_0197441816 /NCGR_PEP_ID=MMETSP1175-20131217/7978_1 /TAXON_ID=1003142 /ORGANISM="Triceratium dubium, Strain CCMP147" /LENGTH=493 /DNA_ID=CAMNT_0042972151 /DNA_START=220 /DNA_END=1701 /DNA_ORIENTATION=-
MIRCNDVVGGDTTEALSAPPPVPLPSTNDNSYLHHNVGQSSPRAATHIAADAAVVPSPNSSESTTPAIFFAPESNRAQDDAVVVPPPSVPSSSLDALALACAAQDAACGNNGDAASSKMDELPASAPPQQDTEGDSSSSSSGLGSPPPSFQLTNNDVLCGRGGLTNHHPGNVFFRRLVRSRQEDYLRASKRDKAGVARDIVDTIRKLDPPGRFLKKDSANPGLWVEIGNRKAREKTSQALREGAPEKREELSTAHPVALPPLPSTAPGAAVVVAAEPPTLTVPVPQVFTSTSITSAEMDQAARASVGCIQRARVVSSDSDGGSGSSVGSPVSTSTFAVPFRSKAYFSLPAPSSSASPDHHLLSHHCYHQATDREPPTTTTDEPPFLGNPAPPPALVTPTGNGGAAAAPALVEPMDTSASNLGGRASEDRELPIPPLFCGTKRKLEHSSCAVQQEDHAMHEAHHQDAPSQRSPGGTKRGPRLRIFKERMMELCH